MYAAAVRLRVVVYNVKAFRLGLDRVIEVVRRLAPDLLLVLGLVPGVLDVLADRPAGVEVGLLEVRGTPARARSGCRRGRPG